MNAKTPLEKYLDERTDRIVVLNDQLRPLRAELNTLRIQDGVLRLLGFSLIVLGVIAHSFPLMVFGLAPALTALIFWSSKTEEVSAKLAKNLIEIRLTSEQLQMLSAFASSLK